MVPQTKFNVTLAEHFEKYSNNNENSYFSFCQIVAQEKYRRFIEFVNEIQKVCEYYNFKKIVINYSKNTTEILNIIFIILQSPGNRRLDVREGRRREVCLNK